MIDLEIFTAVLKELGYLDHPNDDDKEILKKNLEVSKNDRKEDDGDT